MVIRLITCYEFPHVCCSMAILVSGTGNQNNKKLPSKLNVITIHFITILNLKVEIFSCILSQEPFNSSCSDYMKMDARIESCIVFMCECLQRSLDASVLPSKDVLYDFFNFGSCKCEAYESFVEACENAKQGPVQEWRIRHDCSKFLFLVNVILCSC